MLIRRELPRPTNQKPRPRRRRKKGIKNPTLGAMVAKVEEAEAEEVEEAKEAKEAMALVEEVEMATGMPIRPTPSMWILRNGTLCPGKRNKLFLKLERSN